jgi:diguanylate cyclase (GGDEF)-like protein
MTSPASFSPPECDEAHLAPRPARGPASFLARLAPRPFRADLEEEFHQWRQVRSLSSWRALLVSGCLAFGIFTLWDYIVAPEQYWLLVPVRILFCIITMVLLAATYNARKQRHLLHHLTLLIVCYSLSLTWILNVIPNGWNIGLMGFAFPLVALMTIPQARLLVVNSFIILCLVNGSLWWLRAEPVMLANVNFFLIGLSGMAYVLAFFFEARERRLFELERHLERLATVDALSDAWNRRHFTHLSEVELQRAFRYGRPLSLLLLDIDHFKKINDTFGHAVGDEAIRFLSSTCRQTLRRSDELGRLGGEEFGILLPETDLEAALLFAERLRTQIADACVPLDSQPEPLRFTTSIGVAAARAGDTFDTLLHRADVALYNAKGAGRNRVVAE